MLFLCPKFWGWICDPVTRFFESFVFITVHVFSNLIWGETRLSFLVNDLSHEEHSYDFSLSCNSECLVNESFLANPLWQIKQESGTWCVLVCAFRWALLAKLFRHVSHVFNIDYSELTKLIPSSLSLIPGSSTWLFSCIFGTTFLHE